MNDLLDVLNHNALTIANANVCKSRSCTLSDAILQKISTAQLCPGDIDEQDVGKHQRDSRGNGDYTTSEYVLVYIIIDNLRLLQSQH